MSAYRLAYLTTKAHAAFPKVFAGLIGCLKPLWRLASKILAQGRGLVLRCRRGRTRARRGQPASAGFRRRHRLSPATSVTAASTIEWNETHSTRTYWAMSDTHTHTHPDILILDITNNETLYRWTFNFHKVVRQQNSGAVEDFILPYSAVYLRI